MADRQNDSQHSIIKNSEITVIVDDIACDVILISYKHGGRIFRGVLLDTSKKSSPFGILPPSPVKDNSQDSAQKSPDDFYSLCQRWSYFQLDSCTRPTSKKGTKPVGKVGQKGGRMNVRLRPRHVLCSKCKSNCNENSESVGPNSGRSEGGPGPPSAPSPSRSLIPVSPTVSPTTSLIPPTPVLSQPNPPEETECPKRCTRREGLRSGLEKDSLKKNENKPDTSNFAKSDDTKVSKSDSVKNAKNDNVKKSDSTKNSKPDGGKSVKNNGKPANGKVVKNDSKNTIVKGCKNETVRNCRSEASRACKTETVKVDQSKSEEGESSDSKPTLQEPENQSTKEEPSCDETAGPSTVKSSEDCERSCPERPPLVLVPKPKKTEDLGQGGIPTLKLGLLGNVWTKSKQVECDSNAEDATQTNRVSSSTNDEEAPPNKMILKRRGKCCWVEEIYRKKRYKVPEETFAGVCNVEACSSSSVTVPEKPQKIVIKMKDKKKEASASKDEPSTSVAVCSSTTSKEDESDASLQVEQTSDPQKIIVRKVKKEHSEDADESEQATSGDGGEDDTNLPKLVLRKKEKLKSESEDSAQEPDSLIKIPVVKLTNISHMDAGSSGSCSSGTTSTSKEQLSLKIPLKKKEKLKKELPSVPSCSNFPGSDGDDELSNDMYCKGSESEGSIEIETLGDSQKMVLRKKRSVGSMEDLWDERVLGGGSGAKKAKKISPVIKISFGGQGKGTVLKIPASRVQKYEPGDDGGNEEGNSTPLTKSEEERRQKHKDASAKAARKALKKAKRRAMYGGASPASYGGASPYFRGGTSPYYYGGASPYIHGAPYGAASPWSGTSNSFYGATSPGSKDIFIRKRHKHKMKHKKRHRDEKKHKENDENEKEVSQSCESNNNNNTEKTAEYEVNWNASSSPQTSPVQCPRQKLSISLKRLNANAYTQSDSESKENNGQPFQFPSPRCSEIEDSSSSEEHGDVVPSFPTIAVEEKRVEPLTMKICTQNVDSCITEEGRTLSVGDVVWGKIHGCPWWPAKVMSITVSRRDNGSVFGQQAEVSWYGSSSSSCMPCHQLCPFLQTFKSRYNKKKRGAYKDAIKQATCDAQPPPPTSSSPVCVPERSPVTVDVVS